MKAALCEPETGLLTTFSMDTILDCIDVPDDDGGNRRFTYWDEVDGLQVYLEDTAAPRTGWRDMPQNRAPKKNMTKKHDSTK